MCEYRFELLRAFFYIAAGRANGFRFKDAPVASGAACDASTFRMRQGREETLMSDKPYDEPAFPINGAIADNQFNGMSLRDYFAAKAMQALLADPSCDYDELGANAYALADVMLKARLQ